MDPNFWGPPIIEEEDPNEWVTDYNFWPSPDPLEQDAINKECCLEVLRRQGVIVDEESSEQGFATLDERIDRIKTSFRSKRAANDKHDAGEQSQLQKEPADETHVILEDQLTENIQQNAEQEQPEKDSVEIEGTSVTRAGISKETDFGKNESQESEKQDTMEDLEFQGKDASENIIAKQQEQPAKDFAEGTLLPGACVSMETDFGKNNKQEREKQDAVEELKFQGKDASEKSATMQQEHPVEDFVESTYLTGACVSMEIDCDKNNSEELGKQDAVEDLKVQVEGASESSIAMQQEQPAKDFVENTSLTGACVSMETDFGNNSEQREKQDAMEEDLPFQGENSIAEPQEQPAKDVVESTYLTGAGFSKETDFGKSDAEERQKHDAMKSLESQDEDASENAIAKQQEQPAKDFIEGTSLTGGGVSKETDLVENNSEKCVKQLMRISLSATKKRDAMKSLESQGEDASENSIAQPQEQPAKDFVEGTSLTGAGVSKETDLGKNNSGEREEHGGMEDLDFQGENASEKSIAESQDTTSQAATFGIGRVIEERRLYNPTSMARWTIAQQKHGGPTSSTAGNKPYVDAKLKAIAFEKFTTSTTSGHEIAFSGQKKSTNIVSGVSSANYVRDRISIDGGIIPNTQSHRVLEGKKSANTVKVAGTDLDYNQLLELFRKQNLKMAQETAEQPLFKKEVVPTLVMEKKTDHTSKGHEREVRDETESRFVDSLLDLSKYDQKDDSKAWINKEQMPQPMYILESQPRLTDVGSSNFSLKRNLPAQQELCLKRASSGNSNRLLNFGMAGSEKPGGAAADATAPAIRLVDYSSTDESEDEIPQPPPRPTTLNRRELERLNMVQLRAIAKQRNLRRYSKIRKAELLKLLADS